MNGILHVGVGQSLLLALEARNSAMLLFAFALIRCSISLLYPNSKSTSHTTNNGEARNAYVFP